MARHKVNIRQVCASIRKDLIERLGIDVPTDEIQIMWREKDRAVWINVNTRTVWRSVEDRIGLEGRI